MKKTLNKKQVLGLLSVLFLVIIGVYFWTRQLIQSHEKLQKTGVSVEGKLIGFDESTNTSKGRTHYNYAPIVAYVVKGKNYQLTSTMESPKDRLPDVGTSMTILYNVENPKDATFGGDYGNLLMKNLYFIHKISIGISILFIGLIIWIFFKKNF